MIDIGQIVAIAGGHFIPGWPSRFIKLILTFKCRGIFPGKAYATCIDQQMYPAICRYDIPVLHQGLFSAYKIIYPEVNKRAGYIYLYGEFPLVCSTGICKLC